MFKKCILAAIAAFAIAPGAALAAGKAGTTIDVPFSFEGPFGTYDKYQLQRGFQVYQKVCASCHGLQYLAFRDLGRPDGPAFPEEQVKAIAAEYIVIDPEHEDGERPGRPSDNFPANDAAGAPDLTLMAKARAGFHGPSGLLINQFFNGIGGPEYIYSILTTYNGKEQEIAGNFLYGNEAMPGGYISMSPPLYEGAAEDYDIIYASFNADGSEVEAKSDDEHHGDDHGYHAPEPTFEQMAEDVSAFLMFAAEPAMVERKDAGLRNLLMVLLLAVLLYYTNKKLWAPIKRKEA